MQKNKKDKNNILEGINNFIKLKNLILKMPMNLMPVIMLKQLEKL
jgi:hypothetical protein